MRLTCPNCDAHYEVPAEVVPVEGRDVQCSSCGQTWYQYHPDHIPFEEEDLPEAVEQVAPPVEADPEPEEELSIPSVEEPPVLPVRKEIDPSIADILKEEAEAEQAARRKAEANTLESQPDLGLEETDEAEHYKIQDERVIEARQRMARLRGEQEPMSEADVKAAAVSSRRDLLPDIEEINSTLRSSTQPQGAAPHRQPTADTPAEVKTANSRFRSGLIVMLAVFAVLAMLYVYAPQIARAMPQMDPYLSSYVTKVDQIRIWLDGHVQSLLRNLDSMATRSGS